MRINWRVFLVCLLIAVGLKLFMSCAKPTESGGDAIEVRNNIDPELMIYYTQFRAQAEAWGIDLSYLDNQRVTIIFAGVEKGTNVATAYGRNKDMVTIIVNRTRFYNRSEEGRQYVMWHEFGHDILDLPHLDHGMMRPSAYSGFFVDYDRVSQERQRNYLHGALQNMFLHYLDNNIVDHISDDNKFEVIHIVDGDTVDIIVSGFKVRLRLLDINTPERGKEGYKEAKMRMKELVLGKKIRVETHGWGRYGRTLAYIYVDGVEINQLMYCEGYAVRYKYSNRTFNCE